MSTEKVSLILELQDKTSKEIQRINEQLIKLSTGVNDTDKNTNKFNSTLIGLGKTALGAVGAFVTLEAAYSKVLANGIKVNKTFEQLQLGIAALGTVNAEYIDSIDKSKTATERFAEAQKFATAQIRALEEINKVTPHTLEETTQIYKVLLPQVLQYGGSLKDLIEITKLVSLTAAAGSVEFNSLLASVDGLVDGTFLANSDFGRFLKTLGLTPDVIKKSDDKLKLLTESMQDFAALAPELGKSYDAALSNLANSWDKLTAKITDNIFNNLKPAFAALGSWFDDLTANITKIEDRGIAQLEKDISKTVDSLAELNKQAEETWLPGELNIYADRARMVQGELERMLKTYEKLIEEQNKLDSVPSNKKPVPSNKKPEAVVSYVPDKTIKFVPDTSEYDRALLQLAEEEYLLNVQLLADEQAAQEFANGIQGILASSITEGIASALEGDFDAELLVKGLGKALLQYGLMLELTSETSVLAGITKGMAGAANPALGAALIGGALIGGSSLFGGSSKPKMSLDDKADRAFNNLIKAIEANTEILALTRPGTATAQKTEELKARETILLGDIGKAEALKPFLDDEGLLKGLEKKDLKALDIENFRDAYKLLSKEELNRAELLKVQTELTKQDINAKKDLALLGDVSTEQATAFIDNETKRLGLQKKNLGFDFEKMKVTSKLTKDSITSANFLEKLDEATVRANNSILGLGDELTEADKAVLEIAKNSPEAVDALRNMNTELEEASQNFKNMATSLGGIVDQQQNYIDTTIGLTQSGQDNIAYLQQRLAIEDEEADLARKAVAEAGTDATADMIANLAQQEQDVIDISKLLSTKATEVFGSTDAATNIINDTLKIVGDNQKQTVTIETAMLEASLASVDQLKNINTKLDKLAVDIANEIARAS